MIHNNNNNTNKNIIKKKKFSKWENNCCYCNPRAPNFPHVYVSKQVVGECGSSFFNSLVSPPSPALPSPHSTDASVFPPRTICLKKKNMKKRTGENSPLSLPNHRTPAAGDGRRRGCSGAAE